MNTQLIKEIGSKLMLIGAVTFFGGFGLRMTGSTIEYGEKRQFAKEEMKLAEAESIRNREARDQQNHDISAKKDELWLRRIEKMNNSEFAKYAAEAKAKVNDEVIRKAKNDISKKELECTSKIMEIENDCSTKVKEAADKYYEMKKKYDELNALFKEKDDVLDAKKSLEKLAEKKKDTNKEMQDVAESISKLLGV